MFDLVITDGKVVSPMTTNELDVGIIGKEVASLSKLGTLVDQAKKVIQAKGLLVLPGAIDPHTHTPQGGGAAGHGGSVQAVHRILHNRRIGVE